MDDAQAALGMGAYPRRTPLLHHLVLTPPLVRSVSFFVEKNDPAQACRFPQFSQDGTGGNVERTRFGQRFGRRSHDPPKPLVKVG